MPVRINQPIKQTTLNDSITDFIQFMGKYTSFDTFVEEAKDERVEAEEAHQDSILSQLDDEIHSNNLIVWEHDSDGDRMNTDNLMEWLSLYYTIEKK